jgi:hypothetical protein
MDKSRPSNRQSATTVQGQPTAAAKILGLERVYFQKLLSHSVSVESFNTQRYFLLDTPFSAI